MELIISRDESFWPPASTTIQPHPMLVTLAMHLLIAALYNYDEVKSGRSEDFSGYLDMSDRDRERYRAELVERG